LQAIGQGSLDLSRLFDQRYFINDMGFATPIPPPDDLVVAKKFYVDGLGFRVPFEASGDGRSGVLGLERGTIHLTVISPMKGHGRNACVALNDAEHENVLPARTRSATPCL
jgi:hypothetical protein